MLIAGLLHMTLQYFESVLTTARRLSTCSNNTGLHMS